MSTHNTREDFAKLAHSVKYRIEQQKTPNEEGANKALQILIDTHHQELQKVREQRKGWKGYVVVDPKADNYKYSPIYMDRREATLWLAENGDDDLEVAEVDILLAHQSELDQPTV